jgi:hypothetical protein
VQPLCHFGDRLAVGKVQQSGDTFDQPQLAHRQWFSETLQ